MKYISIGISSIDIGPLLWLLITSLHIACFIWFILLVQAPRTFIGICKKIFFTSTSIKNCLYCLETNLIHFVLTLFHPKKAMVQVPCFDIEEYSRSYGPFLFRKSKVEQNTNNTVILSICNKIIFLLDGFQPHHPAIIPTTHMLILMHCSLCFHYVKFPIIVVVTFYNFFLNI